MYPGGAPDQNQPGNEWTVHSAPTEGYEAQPVEYEVPPNYPQSPYLPDPTSPQPGSPQPGYPQPGYPQPGYQPPAQGYPPPGYQQAPGYQQVPGYQYQPAPVPPGRSGQTGLIVTVAAVVVVAVLVVVVVLVRGSARSTGQPTAGGPSAGSASSTPQASPQASQGLDNQPGPPDPGDGLVIGSGPVRVDVYVDYQCPPCAAFEQATGDTLTNYLSSKRITLSIHPVAFIDDRSRNQYSTRAAAAMACAYEQGKALALHGYLLRHQPPEDTAGPTDAELASAGDSLGLGPDFDSCVTGGQMLDWVDQATSAADSDGVTSVPAVYVNDQATDATEAALVAAVDGAT